MASQLPTSRLRRSRGRCSLDTILNAGRLLGSVSNHVILCWKFQQQVSNTAKLELRSMLEVPEGVKVPRSDIGTICRRSAKQAAPSPSPTPEQSPAAWQHCSGHLLDSADCRAVHKTLAKSNGIVTKRTEDKTGLYDRPEP